MILTTAALCLAANIYHEARGQIIPGQYAVAMVTMNRAKQDSDRVCDVVFQRKQFSWANRGVTKVKGGYELSDKLKPREEEAWFTAQRIANVVLNKRLYDLTQGSNYYHAKSVLPYWAKLRVPTWRIGDHVFYAVNQS